MTRHVSKHLKYFRKDVGVNSIGKAVFYRVLSSFVDYYYLLGNKRDMISILGHNLNHNLIAYYKYVELVLC